MDKNIVAFYHNNRILIAGIYRVIPLFQRQNFDRALRKSSLIFDCMHTFLKLLPECREYLTDKGIQPNEAAVLGLLQELMGAQERKDYVLLADLYEISLLPLLYQLQAAILSDLDIMKEHNHLPKNIDYLEQNNAGISRALQASATSGQVPAKGYSIEATSSGDVTLAVERDGSKRYFHSNLNVWKEAIALAQAWYSPEKSKYLIYGLGMGYHIVELLALDEFLEVEIYESDPEVLRLACTYTDHIHCFASPRVQLFYDPDFTKLAERLDRLEEEAEFVIHYPSMVSAGNRLLKEKLENYFIQYSSVKNQYSLLKGNFNKNIRCYDRIVDELKESFSGRSLYIIAAGPSLDKNFHQLKDVAGTEKGIILATGTVFKKLMKAGIRPDYVLVTDPNERVYGQLAGMEDCGVPLLFLSTAYYKFAQLYKGTKYIVFQRDYRRAEEKAASLGAHCYRTGGSVSTAALDIGIGLGCSRIIFVGLDLAFTDQFAHASDTSRRNITQLQDMRQVEDIHGNLIYTSRSLDLFRIWIENCIRETSGIEFIDATEGGARIKGMRIAKLADVMK